jgi:steroid delta-isomerase-like uncharacterized protein
MKMQSDMTIPAMVDAVRNGKMQRRKMMKILASMGVSAAGIGAIAAATTHHYQVLPTPVVNPQENSESNLTLHSQHIANQNQGNLDALYNDYAEHAVVEDSMYSSPIMGREAIIARKTLGLFATTDVQITVLNRIAIGNQVTVEWMATGVHTGDLPGLPASNQPFTLRGVTVAIRENGKIVREALYYNVEDLWRQLHVS